ncbi:hypothetical protein KSP40_PGU006874 [Platanthera guangdongensis]|uniref:Uncharacterized protein n=1 Tax=Platanthera guangdongensis TaxID=2320717 RepID=A0ABR2LC90_9ASPA
MSPMLKVGATLVLKPWSLPPSADSYPRFRGLNSSSFQRLICAACDALHSSSNKEIVLRFSLEMVPGIMQVDSMMLSPLQLQIDDQRFEDADDLEDPNHS